MDIISVASEISSKGFFMRLNILLDSFCLTDLLKQSMAVAKIPSR